MGDETICTICEKPLQNDADFLCTVQTRGLKSFIKKSEARQDEMFKRWTDKETITVHNKCRKRYSSLPSRPDNKKRTRTYSLSSLPSFSISDVSNDFRYDEYCFICSARLDKVHKKVSNLTPRGYKHILYVAYKRNDEAGTEVLNRLGGISLEEKQPQYHSKCYYEFTKWKPKSRSVTPEPSVPAEEITEPHNTDSDNESCDLDTETYNSLENVYQYIEESGKFQFFLSELQEVIGEEISNKSLCNRIKQRFNEDIFIQKHRGRETVIYYKTFNLVQICSDWLSNESIDRFEKNAIVTFAAEILRAEVWSANYKNSFSLRSQEFSDNVNSEIPQLLEIFLNHLLPKANKENNKDRQAKSNIIARSIISCVRPRASLSKLELVFKNCTNRRTGSSSKNVK